MATRSGHSAREAGTARLIAAVDAFHKALEVYSQGAEPLDWAGTHNNLGNALQTRAERETGTARLTEAVNAYRRALEVYSRATVPLDWARTQNIIGNALQTLGARYIFQLAGDSQRAGAAELNLAHTTAPVARLSCD